MSLAERIAQARGTVVIQQQLSPWVRAQQEAKRAADSGKLSRVAVKELTK